MNVIEHYACQLSVHGYQADRTQYAAIERLQRCYDEWQHYLSKRSNPLKRLIYSPEIPQGVYLWGGVGRGKSFLMDSFYACVPGKAKTRLHFHEFMRAVHAELKTLSGTADPLDKLAQQIAQRYQLICFDEFHISDIADAMVLYRLLAGLFKHRVQFVMTSNYKPDTLYPDGLHRERILPAISLLNEKLNVLNVDSGIDYRQYATAQGQVRKVYHIPLGPAADKALEIVFTSAAQVPDENTLLQIGQREISARRCAKGVVWFDFETLCGNHSPRSQNDYLELASCFHTIIVSDVPRMTPQKVAEARRFTWLVDVLYDQKVKLFLSAAVPADQLYVAGPLAHEFSRTVSRLTEMQSQTYLDAPRCVVSAAPMSSDFRSE